MGRLEASRPLPGNLQASGKNRAGRGKDPGASSLPHPGDTPQAAWVVVSLGNPYLMRLPWTSASVTWTVIQPPSLPALCYFFSITGKLHPHEMAFPWLDGPLVPTETISVCLEQLLLARLR